MSVEMSLPEGWITAQLGKYVYLKNGYAFKSTTYVNEKGSNTVPIIRISDIDGKNATDLTATHILNSDAASGFEVEKNDLLIAMSGATTGKVGVYTGNTPAYQNQRVGNLKFISNKHKSENFRNHLVTYLSPEILEIAYGGAQPNISGKAIEEMMVVIPPLAEQHQIAQRLDELLAQVDTIKARLDAIPAILKRFRQSVLSAAVSGKLTEEWRGNSELIDWKKYSLSQLINKPSYGSSAKSDKEGKIPVLRMGNIQNGKIDWSDLVYSSDDDEIKKYTLEKDDVLFNRTNSPELVGKTAIYKGEQKAIYAGYLIKVRCQSSLDPDYLNFHLNSPQAKHYCMFVKTDGVSQSNINAQKLGAYIIHCPPINEQHEIVRRVESFLNFSEQITLRINEAKSRIDKLTQSILAKAFRGELTADWRAEHPELISGENSAEALLAKIQAAKAAIDSKKIRKKTI